MRTKILLFAMMAIILGACTPNEPDISVQTYNVDNLIVSYYLSDINGNVKHLFSQGEIMLVHLNIHNNQTDTILTNSDYMGTCYDSKEQVIDALSFYSFPDTISFRETAPNATSAFTYAFVANISSGSYHFKEPRVITYAKGIMEDKKEYIIPLTIKFEVQ